MGESEELEELADAIRDDEAPETPSRPRMLRSLVVPGTIGLLIWAAVGVLLWAVGYYLLGVGWGAAVTMGMSIGALFGMTFGAAIWKFYYDPTDRAD